MMGNFKEVKSQVDREGNVEFDEEGVEVFNSEGGFLASVRSTT